nr:phospholipase A2 family protein [Methylobacterium dankookense]
MIRFLPVLLLALWLGPVQGALAQAAAAPPPPEPEIVVEEPRPGPPPPLPDIADPNSRTGESLGEPGPRSGIPKALRGSAAKSGGPANDLNPSGQPEEAPLPKADLAAVLAGKALFHGNYCGAGQQGEGLPPTDDLDAACMRHDACYDAAGYRSCACDAALKREAGAVSERPGLSRQVRERALSVTEAADAMGCKAP